MESNNLYVPHTLQQYESKDVFFFSVVALATNTAMTRKWP